MKARSAVGSVGSVSSEGKRKKAGDKKDCVKNLGRYGSSPRRTEREAGKDLAGLGERALLFYGKALIK